MNLNVFDLFDHHESHHQTLNYENRLAISSFFRCPAFLQKNAHIFRILQYNGISVKQLLFFSNWFIFTCPVFLHPPFQKCHAAQHDIWFVECFPVLASSDNRVTDIICVDIWQKTPCYLSHAGKQVTYHV